MLPFDEDATEAEKLQWTIYQIKVWEKLMIQLANAVKQKNTAKIGVITNLFFAYGDALSSKDFEFELEKLLVEKEIFDTARDLL